MRDSQEHEPTAPETSLSKLVALQNVVIKGLRNIRRRRLLKYAYPIVLEGWEGVIIRDLLELIAAGDRNVSMKHNSTIYYEKSIVLCSQEFPLPGSSLSSSRNNVKDNLGD